MKTTVYWEHFNNLGNKTSQFYIDFIFFLNTTTSKLHNQNHKNISGTEEKIPGQILLSPDPLP